MKIYCEHCGEEYTIGHNEKTDIIFEPSVENEDFVEGFLSTKCVFCNEFNDENNAYFERTVAIKYYDISLNGYRFKKA